MDAELIEKVRARVQASVTEKRYAHSLRTGAMARLMCERYGVDAEKGYFAGIAHDVCKDCSDETLIALASQDGNPITELERAVPALLHGRAAAVTLHTEYGVTDSDILQAVANHTLGGADLCALAKILYAADKIEPGRPQSTDSYRERLLALSLDELVLAVVDENSEYLQSRGKPVAPESITFRDSLRKSIAMQVE